MNTLYVKDVPPVSWSSSHIVLDTLSGKEYLVRTIFVYTYKCEHCSYPCEHELAVKQHVLQGMDDFVDEFQRNNIG